MKNRLPYPAAAAAGLSLVYCLALIAPLVSPDHQWIYHDSGAPASIFLPVFFNMVVLWLFFALLLLFARRNKRFKVMLWSGVILFTPWMLLTDLALLFAWRLPHRFSVGAFLASGLVWVVIAAMWRPGFVPHFVRLQRFSSRMLAFAGVCSLFVIAQMFWFFWQARSLQSPRPLHRSTYEAVAAARAQRPRIIWIILDELSYQQVYERRFPALDLPAFDQLASEATVFTQVAPAANATELAVPSLMTGLPVDHIRAGGDGTLRLLHNPDTGRWQLFHPQDTVFQDALNHGFRTGVAGWYNPYCRVLPEVLDRCQWVLRETDGGIPSDGSLASNAAAPWTHLIEKFRRSGSDGIDEAAIRAHIADYADILSAGDRLLQDSSIDFLFLHIPVPHPGGIYDRRTRTFTTHRSSYIDNLALADSYLAHVRQVLEQRGEWDSSAIVVMGDHSWRTTLLWKASTSWTAEDEAASHGGQFDDRPGYIVKLPYQKGAAKIESPFSAVKTRALLQGILDGSIRSVPQLADFAAQPREQRERPVLVTTRVEGAANGSRDR